MSWTLIARKEVGDLRRNRQFHGMAIILAILFGLLGYVHADSANEGFNEPAELITLLAMIGSAIVPAVALMLSYETVVKRRHGGQLELLLGFPHHRQDVVLGGYVGRFLAVAAVLLAGLWACAAVVVLFGAAVPETAFAAYLVAALVLALAYVGMGTAISASIRSPSWASAAAFGAFMLFVLAWRYVPDGLAYLLNGFERPATSPWWTEYVRTLSPSVAAEELLVAILPTEVVAAVPFGGSEVGLGFAALVLAGWIVLVPLAGYLRFDRTDL